MIKPYANQSIPKLLTRHSVLFMLSAGAFFASGSYVFEGFTPENVFRAAEYSRKNQSDSHPVIRGVSTVPDDEYLMGPDTDKSVKFFSASAAFFIPDILPGSNFVHTDVPVNSFEYSSGLGFSPLRSPPSFS